MDQDITVENGLGKVLVECHGGAECMQMEELTNLITSLKFVEDQDNWVWNLDGKGVFLVSSSRRFIDEGIRVMDGRQMPNPPINLIDTEESDDDTEILSSRDTKIEFNPSDIENNDLVPDLRMFNVPLGNDDSISSSFYATISNPLFDFDDYFTLRIDNKFFDDDFEDLYSLDPTKLTPLIDASILLVTALPETKQICLREVDRFDV
ncbi:hypothetical protein Tco_1502674, partial [Tanacetum coccineum]